MTHENELPDEDLPGSGIFDPEFIREKLREQEERGILLWDEDNNTYFTSARGIMVGIAMGVMAYAQTIDPAADQDEIMRSVVSCLPWEARAEVVTTLEEVDPIDPDAPDFKVPDTLPEEWA